MNKELIAKETFIEIMEGIQKAYDYQSGLNEYFRKHNVDGYIFQPDCICEVLKLLHIVFGEKDSNEWISYFCFELDFGRNYKDGDITDKDGKNIPLKTFDDLYNLLTK